MSHSGLVLNPETRISGQRAGFRPARDRLY